MLDIFIQSYQAVQKYHVFEGFSFKAEMFQGYGGQGSLSALQAFWMGLQVLAGDTAGAIKYHAYWYGIWEYWGAFPEVFDISDRGLGVGQYRDSPLRPEFIESTFYLHMQNRSRQYFDVAREFANNLNTKSRVKCGFAALNDVTSGTLDDRMDSFFISETLTYLYLVALQSFPSHMPYDPTQGHGIFTTEAHLFPLRAYYPYALPDLPRALKLITRTTHWMQCRTLGVFDRLLMENRARYKWVPRPRDSTSTQNTCHLPSAFVTTGGLEHFPAKAAAFGPQSPRFPSHWIMHHDDKRTCCIGGPASRLCFPLPASFHDATNVTFLDTHPHTPPDILTHVFSPVGYYDPLVWGMVALQVEPLMACEKLSGEIFVPTIAIIFRGGCTFVDKVRFAQEHGYKAVIVVNSDDSDLPVMVAEDANDVYVPVVMVSHVHGQKLMQAPSRVFVYPR